MVEGPQVIRLDMEDLDRAVATDPALAVLFRDGWRVAAPLAVESRGVVQLALIMAPPRREKRRVAALAVLVGLCAGATCAAILGALGLV